MSHQFPSKTEADNTGAVALKSRSAGSDEPQDNEEEVHGRHKSGRSSLRRTSSVPRDSSPSFLPDFINERSVSTVAGVEKIYCEEATPGMALLF